MPSVDVRATAQNTLRFTWEQASQNIAANTSTVTWRMQIISTSSGRIISSASKKWNVTVNGVRYSGTNTIGMGGNETRTVASGSTPISHNSNGTKSFSFSFSQEFAITFSGSWVGTISGSGNGNLTNIPRTSSISLSSTSVNIGSNITITINRASSSFTHRVSHSINNAAWTQFSSNATTSVTLTTPTSWYAQIPNATSATVRIRCETYNGSSKIGETISTFTANVPSNVIPTVSAVNVTENTSGLAAKIGAFVQGRSTLRIAITASGAQSSTIRSYRTTINNISYNGQTFTTGIINSSGTISVTSTVTDSRGRTASRTQNITFLAYSPPIINSFQAFRANTSGVATNSGTSLRSNYNYSITNLNNRNDRNFRIEFKLQTASNWTTVTSNNTAYTANTNHRRDNSLSAEQSYDVRMTVSDYFTSTTMMLQVGTEIVPLAINATGRGLGIGGHSTMDALQIFMNAEFTGNVTMDLGGNQILRNTTNIFPIVSAANATWTKGGWGTYGNAGTITSVSSSTPEPDITNVIRCAWGTGDTGFCQHGIPLSNGVTYTMSSWVRLVSGNGNFQLLEEISSSNRTVSAHVATSTWRRFSHTFVAKNGNTRISFNNRTPTGVIDFCGMKLEVGKVATGWSPSHWDVFNYDSSNRRINLGRISLVWGEAVMNTNNGVTTVTIPNISKILHMGSNPSYASGRPVARTATLQLNGTNSFHIYGRIADTAALAENGSRYFWFAICEN